MADPYHMGMGMSEGVNEILLPPTQDYSKETTTVRYALSSRTQDGGHWVWSFASPLRGVTRLSLHSLEIPHVWYNLTTARGNQVFENMTLPEGNYGLMDVVGALDLSYNPLTLRVSYPNQTLTTLTPLAQALGFQAVGETIASGAPRFPLDPYVYINLNDLAGLVVSGDKVAFTAFAKVGITVPAGSLQMWENDVDSRSVYVFKTPQTLSNVEITLLDQNGTPLTLGAPMSLTLEATMSPFAMG